MELLVATVEEPLIGVLLLLLVPAVGTAGGDLSATCRLILATKDISSNGKEGDSAAGQLEMY